MLRARFDDMDQLSRNSSRAYLPTSSSFTEPTLPKQHGQKRRHPLGDASNWVNQQSLSPPRPHRPLNISTSSDKPSPPGMPHHSSLNPGGVLQTIVEPSSPNHKAEDKRVSAISSEGASNRLSQISNTSTNASGKARRKTHIGPWQLGKTIGKGASGRVRKARHPFTGQDAAIKIVSKKSAEHFRSKSFAFIDQAPMEGRRTIPFGIEREIAIMKMMEHPNIIQFFDVWENRSEL